MKSLRLRSFSHGLGPYFGRSWRVTLQEKLLVEPLNPLGILEFWGVREVPELRLFLGLSLCKHV